MNYNNCVKKTTGGYIVTFTIKIDNCSVRNGVTNPQMGEGGGGGGGFKTPPPWRILFFTSDKFNAPLLVLQ